MLFPRKLAWLPPSLPLCFCSTAAPLEEASLTTHDRWFDILQYLLSPSLEVIECLQLDTWLGTRIEILFPSSPSPSQSRECSHMTEHWPMEWEGRVCEQLSGISWREGVCPFSSLPPLAACSVDEGVSHCGWFGGGLCSREGIAMM